MNPVTVERALENVNVREVYDYIVIGAGSGVVLWQPGCPRTPTCRYSCWKRAARIPTRRWRIRSMWPTLLGGELDWGYRTIPQRHAANRVIPCPRGKMLGGCHSHNASAWVRGHRTDFDHWAYQGNPGWDFTSILPIYKKIEDYAGGANAYRGAGGPLYMELPKDPNPLAQAFIEAGREIGLPVVEDNNTAEMEGVSHFNLTIKNGKRHSVARAYLYPAMERPNLTVLMYAEGAFGDSDVPQVTLYNPQESITSSCHMRSHLWELLRLSRLRRCMQENNGTPCASGSMHALTNGLIPSNSSGTSRRHPSWR